MLAFGLIWLMLAQSGGDSTGLIVLVVLGILILLALAGSGNRPRPLMRYCPYCGGQVNYSNRPRGRALRCPHCRQTLLPAGNQRQSW
jgi:hypothetical protein